MLGPWHHKGLPLHIAQQGRRHERLADGRLKELEDENRRLKRMYAEERLNIKIVQEALAKSGGTISTQADGAQGSIR